jgi:hypothetical protein
VDLYLVVNIGLIVGVLVVLGIVTWWLRWWRDRQGVDLVGRYMLATPYIMFRDELRSDFSEAMRKALTADYPGGDPASFEDAMAFVSSRLDKIWRIVTAINIATTVAALIPLGFAVYNLVINNQRQALNFSLLSLALGVVTKGVLFVLTVFITGAIGGAGTVVGTRAMKKAWDRWDAPKEQPPTM